MFVYRFNHKHYYRVKHSLSQQEFNRSTESPFRKKTIILSVVRNVFVNNTRLIKKTTTKMFEPSVVLVNKNKYDVFTYLIKLIIKSYPIQFSNMYKKENDLLRNTIKWLGSICKIWLSWLGSNLQNMIAMTLINYVLQWILKIYLNNVLNVRYTPYLYKQL